MVAKKTEAKEQPVAANAGPTTAVTDPATGATETVDAPDGKGKKISDAEGGAARMATMTPDNLAEATGQTGTASEAKKG